tara:strand:- start:3 stop:731 length:729 start_codon:yes stop_codon:yes gene_type:complete
MSIMDIYGVDPYTGPGGIDAALPDFDLSIPPGIPGMTAPAINFRDAPVPFMLRENNPRVFDPAVNLKNFAQNFPSNVRSGITRGFDLGKTVGSGILSAITGVPFLGNVLTGITSQFQNRSLSSPVIDEFGNIYDPEELNKLNALGGYYTDPARSARRRTARIAKMLERQKLGKKISLRNLQELQRQQALQEKLRMERFEKSGRRAEVRDLQSRIDRGDFDGPSGPGASAAANQDAARGGQYG